jgi:hypothetical protein
MPAKPDYLQLEPGDNATTVRDRLSFLRGKRVLIIWPETGSALNRKLDLVLVQREAARLAIRLAFVSHDPQVIQQANELQISVFETVGASERGRWKRGRMKVFTSRANKPDEEPAAEELMPVASRVRSETFKARRIHPLVQLGALALIIAIIAAVAYFVLPSATVILAPAQERLQVEASIVADPNPEMTVVDIDNGVIPATLIQIPIEETATTSTTGSRDAADTRASGTVIFINQTEQPIDIPSGTVISSSAGTPILFQTTEGALLAGGVGLQVEAPVEALPEFAGMVGNLDVGLINVVNGDLAAQMTVRNLAPTTGGENRSVRSVTQDDRERLLFTLRQQMQSRACEEMTSRIDASQIVLCDTVRIVEERDDLIQFSAGVGETADELSLTMRIVVEATSVSQLSGQQVAFARLAAQIPRGRVLQPETLVYAPGIVQSIDGSGRVGFSITASAVVTAQVEIEPARERLAGLSPADAATYLASELDLQDGIPPQITVLPEWLPHLPLLPFRITIRIESLP